MELPQPHSFGTRGRKPTHDFLSLYSPAQQDPTLTSPGGYLKTHDFLQPLERLGKNVGKGDEITSAGKSLRPPPTAAHILPGGIGTYSINNMPYSNQSQMLTKPKGVVITTAQSSSSDRNEENSNCGSYNGFTLWEEESSRNKGKTGKENNNNQSFVDMLKSAKTSHEDKDDGYDEEEEIIIKKEPPLHHKGFMSVKVETDPDQKPNTLRSKHSATEQRRRSKINDRFSMLREIIPHGDQKRDKASFLLEVIEYIQFLQEKVHKYEDSYRGWNNEPPKKIPLKSERQTEGFTDQLRLSSDNVKEEEPTIENGRISISSIYSQGLLSSLTQSLQSSGVELSQASISVQIDLGKTNPTREVSCMDHSLGRSRLASDREKESDKAAFKKLKTTSGKV